MKILLAALYFLIALGLGYPTLSRYDPRAVRGLRDSNAYAAMVSGTPTPLTHHRFRVLIPGLARPLAALSTGHVGTWNPDFFALLIVNSVFVAWNALLLVAIGRLTTTQVATGVIASFLYLLSFNVSNLQLAGLVDSLELWAILAVTWALLSERWLFLPIIGLVGALGKETTIPLLVVYCVVWCVAIGLGKERSWRPLLAVGAMLVLQVATVFAVQSLVLGYLVGPAELVVGKRGVEIVEREPLTSLFNHEMIFAFVWLLPLGLLRVRRMPKPWVLSSAAAAITALAISVWFGVRGNAARPTYSCVAPILLVSASLFLVDLLGSGSLRSTDIESGQGEPLQGET